MKHNITFLIITVALSLSMIGCCPTPEYLTILHTNDTHSQVEPTQTNEGGYARRMGVIKAERAIDPDLLLLDAGDFCQGTPYFNIYKGRIEIAAMNRMGYDAVTLGNHEFDNGLDTLAVVLKDANFPIVCANYDVTGTPLEGIVKPYTILRRKGVKIGIFGLGVSPVGLIDSKNFAPVQYLDPYDTAAKMVEILKSKGCEVIICLSHLGTYPLVEADTPSDSQLATRVSGIDMIVGGHTHQLYDIHLPNPEGKEIPVRQMAKSGRFFGKCILHLEEK